MGRTEKITMTTGICPHDQYGTLCPKCFPEFHTFLVLKNGVMGEIVMGGLASDVISKLSRKGAEKIYHRIYPNRKTKEQEKEIDDE